MQGSGLCDQAIHDVWRCVQGRPPEAIQQGCRGQDISMRGLQYTRSCFVTLVLHDEGSASLCSGWRIGHVWTETTAFGSLTVLYTVQEVTIQA